MNRPHNPPKPPKCPTCGLHISSGPYKIQICQCPNRPRNRGGKYGHLTLEEIEKVKQSEVMNRQEEIKGRALGMKQRYGIDAIKVCDEILDELNELFEGFDVNLIYGARNFTLGKINYWKEIRNYLKP